MALILRKCKKDGSSSHGFVYGNTGDTVTAPDWDPKPECGNGLHGLKQGNGEWGLLAGYVWLIIEADENDVVDIDQYKCKFRTGKILYRGDKEGLHKYASVMATNPSSAYEWACIIGDKEIMRDRVTESKYSYNWACEIGDREIMIDRVTDPYWAYCWARDIGDKEIMRDRVTESKWAYWWACDIGDKEIMRDRVTESKSAYWWSINIGDREIMIDRVTESEWAYEWAKNIGDKEIMKDRVTDPYYKEAFDKLPS
jgi:hypothetical protein